MNKITIKNIEISITGIGDDDFISLTDMVRAKNPKEPKDVVKKLDEIKVFSWISWYLGNFEQPKL